eukprot:gene11615-14222_t
MSNNISPQSSYSTSPSPQSPVLGSVGLNNGQQQQQQQQQQNWKFKPQTPTDFNLTAGRRKRRNSEPGILVQRSYKNYVTHWKLEVKKPPKNSSSSSANGNGSGASSSGGGNNVSPPHSKQQQQQQQHYPPPPASPSSPRLFPSPSSAFSSVNKSGVEHQQHQSRRNNSNGEPPPPYYYHDTTNHGDSIGGNLTSPIIHQRKHSLGDETYKFHPYKLNSSLDNCNFNNNNNNCTDNNNNNNNNMHNSNFYDTNNPDEYLSPLEGGPGKARLGQRRVSLPILSHRAPYSPERSLSPIQERSASSQQQQQQQYHHHHYHHQHQSSSSQDHLFTLPPLSHNSFRLDTHNIKQSYPASSPASSPLTPGASEDDEYLHSINNSTNFRFLPQNHVHDKKQNQNAPRIPVSNPPSSKLPSIQSLLSDVSEVSISDRASSPLHQNSNLNSSNSNNYHYGNSNQQQQRRPSSPPSPQQHFYTQHHHQHPHHHHHQNSHSQHSPNSHHHHHQSPQQSHYNANKSVENDSNSISKTTGKMSLDYFTT